MWKYEHALKTTAKSQTIWDLYTNVALWHEWDKGLEKVELQGPFSAGTEGTLTPFGQSPVSFRLIEVSICKSFTNEALLPGGTVLHFAHALATSQDGLTLVTHSLTISGPDSKQIGPQIGPVITADIPKTMQCLVNKAIELEKSKAV